MSIGRRAQLAAQLAVAALLLSDGLLAQETTSAYPSPYRIDLVPVPELRQVSGRVELRWASSPFGVAVSKSGQLRYRPVVHLSGLPSPETLGPYSTYVAWATTPTLDPMLKLGEVRNGTSAWGLERELSFDRFLILISAEASAEVETRAGRLVLRGLSPSMAMMPDSHLMLPAVPADGAHAHDGAMSLWPHPPHPSGIAMMPGFEDLLPPVAPFLPEPQSEASVPEARPREVVRLRDGQTLDLVAAPVRRAIGGRSVVLYGFNGQYPGPLIEVEQRSTITIRFHNRTRLPTTVHWHGLRLDNAFDGVPGLTQEPVAPGQTFTYRVYFPDAGLYWYHPHHREDVLQDMGLYGNMLVRPSERERWPGEVSREQALFLDDLLVTDEGLFPWGLESATHALMGRFGNLLLVNGEPQYRLSVDRGEVVRFFLTNASNTRTFNLSFGDARIKLIGGDLGLFERVGFVDSVVIGPAERYVVDVLFDQPGAVPIEHRARVVEHTLGRFLDVSEQLGSVEVGSTAAKPDHSNDFRSITWPDWVRQEIDAAIGSRSRQLERRPDLELLLTLELGDLPPKVLRRMQLDRVYFHPIEWMGTMPMMNWLTTAGQARWILRDGSGRENGAIDWSFRVGQVVKIRLRNDRDAVHAMQHPFHIHGQRFLVLAHNGEPNSNLVWKDTVLLPVGTETDILLELSNPGRWMAHCHIAEHLEAGMKMTMTVTGEPDSTTKPGRRARGE